MFRLAAALRRRLAALAFVLVAAPLTLAAFAVSLDRIGTTFPSFFVMENRVVPSVSGFDWPAHKTRLFHARVVAVDGVAVNDAGDVYDHSRATAAGTPVTYTLEKDGRRGSETVTTRYFGVADHLQVYGILLLIAGLNLVLGAVVGLLRPDDRQARIYLVLSFVGCLFACTPAFLHMPGYPLLTRVYLAAETFFPAAFLHFGLCFPVDRLADRRHRWWPVVPWLIGVVLLAAKLRGFYAEPPDLTALYVSYLYVATSFVAFFVLLVAALRRESEPLVQLRIRSLLPSVAAGGALVIFAFLNNSFAGGNFPLQLGLLLVPLFYASVAWAIVAHDLFGIDRFVRWSFVYAILSVIVYAGYSLLVSILPVLARAGGGDGAWVLGFGLVVLALLLDPLRRLVQRIVDRTFYRTRWSYRQTVSRVSREMTTWRSVDRIVDELTRVLTAEMQLEAVGLVLTADPHAWVRVAEAEIERTAPVDLGDLGPLAARIGTIGSASLLRGLDGPGLERLLAATRARLVLPLVFGDRPTGLLLLGPTRSRRQLGDDDHRLLRTLADQAAVAIENALSYEALAEHNRTLNETVQRRTAQLVQSEQLAALGQLVAGVAHELNNPVGAVHASVNNLQQTLHELEAALEANRFEPGDGDIAASLDESRELLDICSEGSERIRRIVRDLLTFARSDRGERRPVDVREGIESTLRLLGDRIERTGVELVRELAPVPDLVGSAAQLNQVWMNLLTNALDALEAIAGPRRLRVSLRLDAAGGRIIVEVADNGPGMSEDVRAHLFEPFFTTKEIGKGTGLGMSITWGIVRDHGGTIAVDSTPGSGAEVRVELPC